MTDITQIYTAEARLHLCVVIHLCGGEAIGWSMEAPGLYLPFPFLASFDASGRPEVNSRHQEQSMRTVFSFLLVTTFGPFTVAAQQADTVPAGVTRRVSAVRVPNGSITVDGSLSEPEWADATPADSFVQQQPLEGELTTEASEVRFLYDDENLYVGGFFSDRRPERLVANELKRDFSARDGDLFVLVLDTFHDRQNGYGFQTNPACAQRETQSYNDGATNNQSWDAVWYLECTVTDEGWYLEYQIPFKSLRFRDRDVQTWGMQAFRLIKHKNEVTVWSPVPRQFSQFKVSYAGDLEGIQGVRPSRNLRVKPFLRSNVSRADGSTDGEIDGGLDMKVGVGTGLILDATFRTDFSQVEADEQQVNLTRFNLFFPEKREFFLENQGSFQMGPPPPRNRPGSVQSSGPPDLIPFFSRTIGLTDEGTPLPILGGLRLSGKLGRNNIGAMTVQTKEDTASGLPATNYAVARFAREFLTNSSVSGFYLGRERGGEHNRIIGADLRMILRRTLNIDGLLMQSATADVGNGVAGRAGFMWDDGPNQVSASYTTLGIDFRDALGFIPREGVDITNAALIHRIRPQATSRWIREYRPEVTYALFTKDGVGVETQTTSTSLYVDFADASQWRFTYKFNEEALSEPFPIRADYSIDAGRYRFQDAETQVSTNRARRLSVNGAIRFGDFWDGTRSGYTIGGRFRFSPKLATTLTYRRDDVDLPGSSFATDLVTARIDGSFSTRMFLNAFVQYNSQRRAVVSNVRFQFIHHPLSDLFIVFNETRPTDRSLPVDRTLILKLTHLLSF